jgi:hypothetical protein
MEQGENIPQLKLALLRPFYVRAIEVRGTLSDYIIRTDGDDHAYLINNEINVEFTVVTHDLLLKPTCLDKPIKIEPVVVLQQAMCELVC